MEIQTRNVSNELVHVPLAESVSVTPTVSASPDYTAGDTVGGIQTLTGMARFSGGTAELVSLAIVDKANQKPEFTILFFSSNPAVATTTDNAAFAWSTDISKYIGKIAIATADYETIDSQAIACKRDLNLLLKSSGSANLFAVAVAVGAPNLASTSDLIFVYGFR